MVIDNVNGLNGCVTLCCLILLGLGYCECQQGSYGGRQYNRDGVYVPPEARSHRTYVYKDRRYGSQTDYLDPVYKGPTRTPEDRYHNDVSALVVYYN